MVRTKQRLRHPGYGVFPYEGTALAEMEVRQLSYNDLKGMSLMAACMIIAPIAGEFLMMRYESYREGFPAAYATLLAEQQTRENFVHVRALVEELVAQLQL